MILCRILLFLGLQIVCLPQQQLLHHLCQQLQEIIQSSAAKAKRGAKTIKIKIITTP